MTIDKCSRRAVEYLREKECSCVICKGDRLFSFFGRGVSDLLKVLETEPAILKGAFVADKVVGKAAAALMIAGGVAGIHAVIISRPALDLLNRYNVKVVFETLSEHIINRSGTDWCPLERLCFGSDDAAECVSIIKGFVYRDKSA